MGHRTFYVVTKSEHNQYTGVKDICEDILNMAVDFMGTEISSQTIGDYYTEYDKDHFADVYRQNPFPNCIKLLYVYDHIKSILDKDKKIYEKEFEMLKDFFLRTSSLDEIFKNDGMPYSIIKFGHYVYGTPDYDSEVYNTTFSNRQLPDKDDEDIRKWYVAAFDVHF